MKQEMAKKKEQTLRKTKEQCASLLRRTRVANLKKSSKN